MGGHVAGLYAAQYPANVCSLTLICPSGKLRQVLSSLTGLPPEALRLCSNRFRFARSHLSHGDKVHGGSEGD